MRRQQGFSLIELMVVVVIVAILAAVAVPAYRNYVTRSHRVDAQRALTDLAARQERYLYSNNTYTKNLSDLGASSSMAGSYYTVAIDPAKTSTTAFSVVATAVGTQQRDDKSCQTLSLDQAGRQGSTGSTTNDPKCWGR
ncbi:type IV pilin protein [Fulvimonas yonginensis]|uniref:Type IV pilin protein n=1 Tax=Fulvimonas yonginensis TaxID=1495200 RepID=A0ABU8JCG3_9GAMM